MPPWTGTGLPNHDYYASTNVTISMSRLANIFMMSAILIFQGIIIALMITCCYIGHFTLRFASCCCSGRWIRVGKCMGLCNRDDDDEKKQQHQKEKEQQKH